MRGIQFTEYYWVGNGGAWFSAGKPTTPVALVGYRAEGMKYAEGVAE